MDSPAVDLESAAIDALSKRMDAMLQRMQAALARMNGAPEPIASASSSPASPSTATTTSSTSLNTPASSTTPPPTTATATSSIDASTLGFPIIVEPQQAPPARCSTTSLNHDNKSSATPSPATSSLPMPASTTSVVAASSTTAPSTGASISAAPASSTELASPNISTRGEFIDGGLGASRPRRAPPRQPRPRRLRRTPPRRPRSRRPRRGHLRVPWLRRPRRAPPRPPRHRRPRRRVSQPTHPGFVLQVKGTQEVFDEMAPQQDVFKGKILNIMDHELVTVMSTNASSTPSNYISKTFAQISPPLMMLDSMDSLAHEVFVEMPDEINVEKVVFVQSHRKFSEFYRLHVLALPLKILRLFPWCYEIGVHLKHMGTRVNQNPCPPPVHFDFTACEFDVLPLTWPLLVLVKIPLDGIALSTEPSWAHVGCCQDMRLSSLVPWPSPQVGVQKFITSTVLGSLQYCKVLPWPPPMLWKSIGDGGNLQPTPWPYFGCCQNPSPSSFLLLESLSHQTRFVCNHASNKRANGYADVCISNFQSGAPIGSIGTQLVLVMEAQLELSWYVHFDVFKLDKPLRPPWPSPVQFEMQADGVRLRPAPWPFFWGSEATEESEQLSSIEQGQIMRYTVIASCYRYGVQILISVRAREVVLHFNATWVLAWLRFCWEIWISLKSYSLDFTDARQVDCTDIKFNEASYNTTLKSVLLGDSAFSGGHCGHSEEVDGLLIHMTLRSPCSYFIDDFCERDNTKAWRLEILLGQKLVARCQLTVWSVPNKSRGWQVFDRGKFKKGCYKIAVKNEATQLVEKVKSPCVLAYCSLICPILLQIDNFFRSESTSSLVSTQVMHVAILYSDLVKGGSHFIKTISEGNPVTVYWCSVRSDGLFDKHAIQWFQFLPLQQLKCKGGFLDSNVEVLRLELPVRNAHILKVCASILGGFDVHIQTQA